MAQTTERLEWAPTRSVTPKVQPLAYDSSSMAAPLYKRPMDVILASFLLLISAPLFGLIALVVRLTSRGPVFFRQERLGLNGEPFTIIKFRTMYVNVDSKQHQDYFSQYLHGASAPGEASHVFKLRKDPRITPLGGFLRRLGLDELPQLLNVFAGEMSMVGPRPPLEYEVAHYSEQHLARLTIKPGITGIWQTRGRDVVDFESMVQMDLEYVRDMSLTLDLQILIQTVPALVWAYLTK